MSVTRRQAELFSVKANKILDDAEDPREVLDFSYSRQLQRLQQVRRGVADVATSRKRVELQLTGLQQSVDTLERQAREALARRTAVLAQCAELEGPGRRPERAALQDATVPVAHDDLQSRLDAITTGGDVDTELARIKGELAAAPGTSAPLPAPATTAQKETK